MIPEILEKRLSLFLCERGYQQKACDIFFEKGRGLATIQSCNVDLLTNTL